LDRQEDLSKRIWHVLSRVSKPARYVGNEWNVIRKSHETVKIKVALAFPEIYEIGMSNVGVRILYQLVNQREDALAERVFCPHTDMESLMKEESIPLFSLESFTPVTDFHLVGFSLQHELNYTNVLTMLQLAGIPLYTSHRSREPLVIGGGTCAFNPEPLAPFFDFFILGDGEEALEEVLNRLQEYSKDSGAAREKILLKMARIPGVYVPCFYEEDTAGRKGSSLRKGNSLMVPKKDGVPETVTKRTVQDLENAVYPLAPIVPYLEAIHDRAVLEIARGCPRGCRFCQAGITYRPLRFRSPEKLCRMARQIIDHTGYEELSLVSLSSTDYPYLDRLLAELSSQFSGEVNLSLPSQRLDAFSVKLAEEVQKRHQTSLTFAPEAGTERLRRAINKNITDEEIYEAMGRAFDGGWKLIKLYFMIGLPTETDEDLEGIFTLCRDLWKNYQQKGLSGKLKLSISISPFVPKPHTPFQWEPQISLEEMYRKIKLLRQKFSGNRSLELKWHEPEMSCLEAALSRGDQNLAPVLENAWKKGARLDNWSEFFSLDIWKEAFAERGLSLEDYAQRRYEIEEILPWNHLNTGVKEKFLRREHSRAYRCGLEHCENLAVSTKHGPESR